MDVQVKIEMRGVAVPGQPFDTQLTRRVLRESLAVGHLVVEHHLKQRVQTQAALRLQRLYQLLERQVLMGLGVQRALLDLLQQLGNGGLPIDISLEHLSVDEKANEPFSFNAIAVGNRHTDADVFLTTVAMQ
ncbi:hypothetical protein FX984_06370 [Pseudomonas marginalis]|nr:hypothetical protein FX984_06370 [Pseudomonas marginalis]